MLSSICREGWTFDQFLFSRDQSGLGIRNVLRLEFHSSSSGRVEVGIVLMTEGRIQEVNNANSCSAVECEKSPRLTDNSQDRAKIIRTILKRQRTRNTRLALKVI